MLSDVRQKELFHTTIQELNREYILQLARTDTLYGQAAARVGLSSGELIVLYTLLLFREECTQSNLSSFTGLNRKTIHSVVRKLERQGILFLERGIRKGKAIRLTPSGEEFAEEKVRPVIQADEAVMAAWSEEDRAELLRLTRKYHDDLKEKLQEVQA